VTNLRPQKRTPADFCQEQLQLLGDEQLVPLAQAATLELLHSTVLHDPDVETFETRLRVLARASTADGTSVGLKAFAAKVLLDAWNEAQHSA
jgi:hypothetical protein